MRIVKIFERLLLALFLTDNRARCFRKAAFDLTRYHDYTGPEEIVGFPKPEVSLQKDHREKISGRYSTARGHIKASEEGQAEIPGELTFLNLLEE